MNKKILCGILAIILVTVCLTGCDAGTKKLSPEEASFELARQVEKIYDDGSYKNYSLRDDGIIFMTYADVKAVGIKVDDYVVNCEENDPIIYFDPVEKNVNGYPISTVYDCKAYKEGK